MSLSTPPQTKGLNPAGGRTDTSLGARMESDAWATSPTDRGSKGVIWQYIHGPAIIMLKSGAGNAICFQPGFNQDFFNEGPRRPIAGAPLMNARVPHGRTSRYMNVICVFQKKVATKSTGPHFRSFSLCHALCFLLDSGSFRLALRLGDSFCFFRIALYLGVNSLAFALDLRSGFCS